MWFGLRPSVRCPRHTLCDRDSIGNEVFGGARIVITRSTAALGLSSLTWLDDQPRLLDGTRGNVYRVHALGSRFDFSQISAPLALSISIALACGIFCTRKLSATVARKSFPT